MGKAKSERKLKVRESSPKSKGRGSLRKNPELLNPESRKRENLDRNKLECKNLEYDIT